MSRLEFNGSPSPTVGVEIELALVDAGTMALRNANRDVLERVPPAFAGEIKPELMQCYVEVNTGICDTVEEAEQDLREKLHLLESITDDLRSGPTGREATPSRPGESRR